MRRLSLHGLAWCVLTSVVLLVCPVEAGARQTARVGREFKVKVGQTVTFKRERLRLKFASVVNDSRCPIDVTCVWAGNAEVLIEAGMQGLRGKRTLSLNTNVGPERAGEGEYRGYTVKLVELSPRPRSKRKIKASEYTATLLVVKE